MVPEGILGRVKCESDALVSWIEKGSPVTSWPLTFCVVTLSIVAVRGSFRLSAISAIRLNLTEH